MRSPDGRLPVCNGDEKIYLATINMRDHQIYKVCNFSRRKYVKSFPTVDYWLSIVPIMPIIQKAVEEFCCVALPDLFGRPTVPAYDEDAPRRAPAVRYSVARENVDPPGTSISPPRSRTSRRGPRSRPGPSAAPGAGRFSTR